MGYLRECVGEVEEYRPNEMVFPFGSTQVSVSIAEDSDGSSTFVHLSALVANEVPVSDELLRWLATASNDFLFGRVTLHFDGEGGSLGRLGLQHTLLGDFLDLEELRTAVAFLASTADHLDDTVVQRFGGHRHVDSD